MSVLFFFFFFNDTATTEIYTLSLHDALPIFGIEDDQVGVGADGDGAFARVEAEKFCWRGRNELNKAIRDRKSTRLNSSHSQISYAVFCLKKKKNTRTFEQRTTSTD